MQLIRIKNPSIIRKKVPVFSRSWVRCFRILPFILLFVTLLAFSFYSVSQNPTAYRRNIHSSYIGFGNSPGILKQNSQMGVTLEVNQGKVVAYGDTQFKLDPLIDRNASSPESWTQQFINYIQSIELGSLIVREANITRLKTFITNKKNHNSSQFFYENKHFSSLMDCEDIPDTLIGQSKVSAEPLKLSEDDILHVASPLTFDGGWKPNHCLQKYQVALIIPYRDRKSHLLQLLYYLHPMLKRQQLNYKIFVVEQTGNGTFNKGAIMNAAFHTILKNHLLQGPLSFICFIFHDVDMLPEDDRNIYSCSDYPRHLSVSVNEFGYRLPYYELVGGVFAISTRHFFMVNGYSNLYWGWGGEDDDMGYRLIQVGLPISRPPPFLAKYTMIKHVKRRPLAYKVRSKLVRTSKRRYRLDGLNTLKYQLISITRHYLFTNILVDVGNAPKSILDLQREDERIRNATKSRH